MVFTNLFIHIPTIPAYQIIIWILSGLYTTSASSMKNNDYVSTVINWKSSYDQSLSSPFRKWKRSKKENIWHTLKKTFPRLGYSIFQTLLDLTLHDLMLTIQERSWITVPAISFLLHRSIVMSTEMERHENDCTISRKIKIFLSTLSSLCNQFFHLNSGKFHIKSQQRRPKKVLKRNLLKA